MLERLKKLRKLLSLSQKEFAEKIGIKQSSYSSIEKGRRSLADRYIKSICMAYNVNEQWLRTGEGQIFLSSPQERELVKIFKNLSPVFQDYLIKMARGLVEVQKDKE